MEETASPLAALWVYVRDSETAGHTNDHNLETEQQDHLWSISRNKNQLRLVLGQE